MLLRAVIIICLLLALAACASNAPETDSQPLNAVPVYAADASGEGSTQIDGAERKLKCRTEKPIGSNIPRKICFWEDDLERAGDDAQRTLNTIKQNTTPETVGN